MIVSPWLLVVWLVLLLVVVVYYFVAVRTLYATKVDNSYVWIKGIPRTVAQQIASTKPQQQEMDWLA